jgi:glucose/arabinose dehydrogenase
MGPSKIAEEVGYDGRPIEMIFPNTYGMIILINLDDYNYEPYSIGHRNPQGLFVDENTGKIWSSEHGPSGGGELNLIVKGNDYGWPDKTLGIPYGPNFTGGNWNSDRWSNHDGFINPIFSWIPSIAPSELVVYYGDEFEFWNGDILLSTLRDTSIRRLRLDEDRVLYDERIFVGERIRDLSILVDGRILMSFDNGQIGIISRLEN